MKTRLLLCVGLLLSTFHVSLAVLSFGPFGRPPSNERICPSACKVKDISIIGNGAIVAAKTADGCIRTCRRQGNSHYSWSQNAKICSCGRCTAGYSWMRQKSGVLSGSSAACVQVPSCSKFLKMPAPKPCPPLSSMKVGSGAKANYYRCCCQAPNPYPTVVGGSLVGCSKNGV